MSRNGGFRLASHRVPLSHLLEGQYIGLEEIDDGIWDVYYALSGWVRWTNACSESRMRSEDE